MTRIFRTLSDALQFAGGIVVFVLAALFVVAYMATRAMRRNAATPRYADKPELVRDNPDPLTDVMGILA